MKPALLFDLTAIAQTAAVPAAPPQRVERTRFCTRCASTADEGSPSAPYGFDRVCERCGMGVMLTAPRGALAGPGAAFLVVTREGRVSAVSEAAEQIVGDEAALVGQPVSEAVATQDGAEPLLALLSRAAGAGREVHELPATVPDRGLELRARIASCGPPRAALLVLERSPL